MKNLIIVIGVVLMSLSVQAQDRTFKVKNDKGGEFFIYKVGDTLILNDFKMHVFKTQETKRGLIYSCRNEGSTAVFELDLDLIKYRYIGMINNSKAYRGQIIHEVLTQISK